MYSRHLALLLPVLLWGCSTARPPRDTAAQSPPETVLITYHVKPGREAELEKILSRAWEIYRQERLVFAEPHVIVRDQGKSGQPRMIEIFTWISHDAPDHAPASVKTIWGEMMSFCEARDGQGAIEGGEVEIIQSSRK